MYTTVNFYDFHTAFHASGRGKQFSYDGLDLIFDYLEQIEQEGEEEIELDVVAICCDFTEQSLVSITDSYNIIDKKEYLTEDEQRKLVRDYLLENTAFIGETSSGCFVFRQF